MSIKIRTVTELSAQQVTDLSHVLMASVEAGASVSFMLPLSLEKAQVYWQGVAAKVATGSQLLFIAENEQDEIIGTVQIALDLPENQPHRADLCKMLVHPQARRQGIAAQLLAAAEQGAKQQGRSLLVLDTANDEAARVYERAAWQKVGTIPDYALWPAGGLCATTIYYKVI
jgi:ribosomal protein S18 acetylase RimI-like enzyme